MGKFALKEYEEGEWRILEPVGEGKWRPTTRDTLDSSELANEVYEMLEERDLDPNQALPRHHLDGSRDHVVAISLVRDWQRRQLGFVIAAQPVMLRPGDPAGRRHGL